MRLSIASERFGWPRDGWPWQDAPDNHPRRIAVTAGGRMAAALARVRSHVGGVLVDTGPLRRHPGLRRLWTGQVVASVGSQLTVVAVGYQTYRLTGSTAMVGLVSLGQLVPLLAGSVLGGPARVAAAAGAPGRSGLRPVGAVGRIPGDPGHRPRCRRCAHR